MIVIIDHKLGNIFSIYSACKFLGYNCIVSSSKKEIKEASKLILPGVGHFAEGMKLYKQMLDAGVAKECARFVLPLATPTKLYMTGSVRSWIHYINLRSAHGTQKEHMRIAEECRRIFCEQFPSVSQALEWV